MNQVTQVITFWGTVQGVGFRPNVARLAIEFRMKGQVRNMGGLVQLIVTDEKGKIDEFVQAVVRRKPRAADIVRVTREEVDPVFFRDFSIARSSNLEDEIAIIPADIAICGRCLAEFYDEGNPRYRHPFISCSECGPRFTIMESLPYDRDTTTMDDFPMCELCRREYKDGANVRFHAQTISCHDCGPQPKWTGADTAGAADTVGTVLFVSHAGHKKNRPHCVTRCVKSEGATSCEGESAVARAIEVLRGGEVVAIKGVGGYYLAGSPFSQAAAEKIRLIKIREEKPFAVMFKDVGEVRKYCRVSGEEEVLLTSKERPIVLLDRNGVSSEFESIPPLAEGVCRSSRFVGAFLPSMGLQYLLLDAVGPLIMTSANRSELPIIKDDGDMVSWAKDEPLIAGVLSNGRRIAVSADDSVVRVIDDRPQLIRRSKGYTPTPVFIQDTDRLTKEDRIFAAGGQLKSAFALSKGSFAYLSQYMGDLDSMESEDVYRGNFDRMAEFFSVRPDLAVCDLHPNYFTTRFAENLGASELLRVQHHHAHVASVMAEHGLEGPVTGVSFDGTGYGADGTVWGGEILICRGADFERYSHLHRVDMIGGDSSMKEGWKSAISWLAAAHGFGPGEFAPPLYEIIAYARRNDTLSGFAREREQAEKAIAAGLSTVKTSSMGRLFDAVSSMLGIHHTNRYEGECAIMLENAAYRAMMKPGVNEADDIALRFHENVAEAILGECLAVRRERQIGVVALSGGVFQNKILMEKTLSLLRKNAFGVYYNVAVPPNDGGIALGQIYLGMQRMIHR